MSTSSTADAHAIDDELNGEWLQARPGERFLIRIPATVTNSRYSVTEILSNPGDSTPVHLHEKEDEHILVVEGTARILYGDKTLDATAETTVSSRSGYPACLGKSHRYFASFGDYGHAGRGGGVFAIDCYVW